MARFHFWGFIVNEAGEPIENAEVKIKLAGLDTLACLYFDEYGGYNTCADPNIGPTDYQLKTLENGYYEFWIGDESESHGYRYDQKFKIEWERVGVAYGMIDHVNILPLTAPTFPANTSACSSGGPYSTEMNKLVSDELVCTWDQHWRKLVENEIVHGIEPVDVTKTDNRLNKVVSNELGWRWDTHKESTVTDYHPSAGPPHNLYEVDITSPDTIRNKVVSDKDLSDLYIQMLKSYLQLITPNMWILNHVTNLWEYTIEHNMNIHYPHVTSYNLDTMQVERMSTITFKNSDEMVVSVNDNTLSLYVRISGQHMPI